MKVAKISREKLYKREYNDDSVVLLGNDRRLGTEPLDGLAKILSIMVKESGRVC